MYICMYSTLCIYILWQWFQWNIRLKCAQLFLIVCVLMCTNTNNDIIRCPGPGTCSSSSSWSCNMYRMLSSSIDNMPKYIHMNIYCSVHAQIHFRMYIHRYVHSYVCSHMYMYMLCLVLLKAEADSQKFQCQCIHTNLCTFCEQFIFFMYFMWKCKCLYC